MGTLVGVKMICSQMRQANSITHRVHRLIISEFTLLVSTLENRIITSIKVNFSRFVTRQRTYRLYLWSQAVLPLVNFEGMLEVCPGADIVMTRQMFSRTIHPQRVDFNVKHSLCRRFS